MHWVYVIKSSRTGNIYVGETTRLFKRWREHDDGKCKTTSYDDYDILIGLYKVANNYTFNCYRIDMIEKGVGALACRRYWGQYEDKSSALALEKDITERYMVDYDIDKRNIRGNFYLNYGRCADFCFSKQKLNYIRTRPLCHCKYPCEINMTKDKTKLYFSCPIPNWTSLEIEEFPCNFYQEFEPYRKAIESYTPKPTARELFMNNN